ncbi:MAG: hypothetical protein RIC57_03390 [Balneola sp.]
MYTSNILVEDFKRLMKFIYKDESWKKLQKTSMVPHVMYRHIVRTLIYTQRECTLSELGIAEGRVLGITARDHSTIHNSLNIVNRQLNQTWKAFYKRLAFYYQLHISREESKEKKGLIEKTKELLKNSPEMNAFILAKVSMAFMIDPEMEKLWKDSTKEIEVSQDFLTQLLNEPETT